MTKPIPDGFHTITPHLVVEDAAKAIEFYNGRLTHRQDLTNEQIAANAKAAFAKMPNCPATGAS